ncbi:MAG: tetratricopeptide repeat protein [Rubricoccaceae bacterium]
MLLLPVLFFALLEGGLRAAGYGGSYPLFVQSEAPGLLVQNRDVARRYFAHTAAIPNANADYFYAAKPEGAFRIVAQGGSSTAGFPYYWGAAFPRVLATRLRAAYPDRPVEVINTAMAAVNSYTLLDFADEILEQQPDVVVIYAGHNEYYGALGAASSETLGRNPRLVRAYLRLKQWRTVQLVRNGVARARAAAGPRRTGERPSQTLMEQMVGEQQVPLGSPVFQAGLEQFRSNMGALLARYAAAGVPVYIGTLAANERDQRPFVTVHTPGADTTAWRAALEAGRAALDAGDAEGAVAAFSLAVAADSLAADGVYHLGRALLAAGRDAEAARAFVRAKDLDALRFRAPEVLNDVIRDLAAQHGARVVEVAEALRAAAPHGAIGREFMLEHLHPTLDGYSLIADAFFDAIAQDGLLGPDPRPAPPGRLVRLATPVDSLVGALRVANLTRNWPFRPDEALPLIPDTTRTPAQTFRIAEALYANRTDWARATDEFAVFATRRGDFSDALTARRALLQMYFFEPGVHVALANLRMEMAERLGQPALIDQAYAHYQQALRLDTRQPTALAMLGAIHLQRVQAARGGPSRQAPVTALMQEDVDTAIGFLERARAVAPSDPQVLYNLSGAYALAGRRDDALRTVDVLLRSVPTHGPAQALRASLTGESRR